MPHALRPGLIGESIIETTQEDSAVAMGSGSLSVFATPALLALMENAATRAIDHLLEEGDATVGIEVTLRHLSATPIGETITAIAEVTYIEDRRVTLEIRAWDNRDLIGECTHVRYIISVDRFLERFNERE